MSEKEAKIMELNAEIADLKSELKALTANEKESEETRRRLYLVIWMTDAMGDFQ